MDFDFDYDDESEEFFEAVFLLENGFVTDVEVRKLPHSYYCSAVVDNHQLHFAFNQYCQIEAFYCSCETGEHCEHLLAVFLFLENRAIYSFPFRYHSDYKPKHETEEEKAERLERERVEAEERRKAEEERKRKALLENGLELLEKYKNVYDHQLNVQLEEKNLASLTLRASKNRDMLSLEFTIGNANKTYVLRNLPNLVEKFDHEEYHYYGKFLSFYHHVDALDSKSQEILNFIKESVQFNNRLLSSYHYYDYGYQYLKIERSIVFNYSNYYDILFKYLNTDEEYGNLKLVDDLKKVEFALVPCKDDLLELQCKFKGNWQAGSDALYHTEFKKTNEVIVHRLSLNEKTVDLLRELKKTKILIEKNKKDEFVKYILQDLAENVVIKGIELPKEVQKIVLYGDIENDEVFFKVEYFDKNNQMSLGFNENQVKNYQQDIVEKFLINHGGQIESDQGKIFFSLNSEKTLLLLQKDIDFLRPYCEIYVSEALRKYGTKQAYHISVGVGFDHNLLALDIESIDIPKGELGNVLRDYRKKKKFYRLKNGDVINLSSDTLEELNDFVDKYQIDLKDLDKDKIELNPYRAFALNDENSEELEINRSEAFKDIVSGFEKKEQQYPISNLYHPLLREYQKDGVQWMMSLYDYHFNGILADDMGLGKTLQIMALLESLSINGPSIVICPASLIYNWADELTKFKSKLKAVCVNGNAEQRKNIIKNANEYQLLITSYDYLKRDILEYKNIEFEYVILDEAQYIKNKDTKNASSVKSLKSKHKLALTGTPIENSLAELWSIFDFLMPGYLYSYSYFKSVYETPIVKENNREKTQALQKLVSPFIKRRVKNEVLLELPEKTETVYTVPFNEEENKLYLTLMAHVNEKIQDIFQMEQPDKMQILALLTRLRQVCIDPRLIYEDIKVPSSKIEACLELLETIQQNNQKVLLFSSFTSVFDLLLPELEKRNIPYYLLTGNTSKEQRRELVAKFQKDKTPVFMISLKAGGTGLNLTAASHVIHIDPWWNMSAQNQATDRAYRIGQHQNVQVYKMVMKNSIEEKIMELQELKKELADTFVNGNGTSLAGMSKEDILELFK